jgi:4-diphosphocytidyl-2-C-methyl-D-erythritol kinase
VRVANLSLPSFAKLNWRLDVLGRRSDGYHELFTLFQTVSLADRLELSSSLRSSIEFECSDPSIPADATNLVVRAALLLKERFDVAAGALIRLEKHIPAGGGMGGGSSNAAVALIGLSKLWNLNPTEQQLWEMARSLGADVPFFLTGGTTAARGLGDIIEPIDDIVFPYLLIATPKVQVSTSDAYKKLKSPTLTKDWGDIILSVSEAEAGIRSFSRAHLRNDFESVVLESEPEIKRVKEALLRTGARVALMSGSGSSVFGIFDNREALDFAVSELEREADWRLFPCSTVSREEYRCALEACAAFLRSNLRD